MPWTDVGALETLEQRGRFVLRLDGGQILLIVTGGTLHAVDNRCPHEGYPLAEGGVDGCTLTCHWHHWKFDLDTGKTVIGEDRLRHYPVRAVGGRIELDLTRPAPAKVRQAILDDLETALRLRRQGQILRETARFIKAAGDPLDLIGHAVAWAGERLEFGTSHAIAAIPDWLALAARPRTTAAEQLVAFGEILGHIADDAFGRERNPFAQDSDTAWDEALFLAAVEREDEAAALELLGSPHAPDRLRPVLARAALSHYADFGHSLIYTVKTLDIAALLDGRARSALLAMLVRSLVSATREDLLPEFQAYADTLAGWGKIPGRGISDGEALRGRSVKAVLGTVAGWSGAPPEAIFAALVQEAAWMLLHADEAHFARVDVTLAQSVGWLDFTHALTFAEAGWHVGRETPDLWPPILLQLACFIGRNAAFVDPGAPVSPWLHQDERACLDRHYAAMFDHGRDQAGDRRGE